jgi:hypothetical protein
VFIIVGAALRCQAYPVSPVPSSGIILKETFFNRNSRFEELPATEIAISKKEFSKTESPELTQNGFAFVKPKTRSTRRSKRIQQEE